MSDLAALVARAGLAWMEPAGDVSDIVLSTRVRLARNLQGLPFSGQAPAALRKEVLDQVRGGMSATAGLEGLSILELDALSVRQQRLLLERRVVSRELVGEVPRAGDSALEGTALGSASAVLLADDPFVSVMINEEDHLRLQVVRPGLDLREAWNQMDLLDETLGSHLPYAFHPEFGFLTSCPTNVGTGLRASVFMHLPALVLTKEMNRVLRGLTEMGLTCRGLYGEGSDVVGNFFQVSNQTTLGRTEEALVDHLDQVVRQVIQFEREARETLLREAADVTEDKVWRAYGLLRYARALSFEELMNLLSAVRLGGALKLIPGVRVYSLNRIMTCAQPGHLEEAAGRPLNSGERERHRASLVRSILQADGAPD
jgi:protein arginine kinase